MLVGEVMPELKICCKNCRWAQWLKNVGLTCHRHPPIHGSPWPIINKGWCSVPPGSTLASIKGFLNTTEWMEEKAGSTARLWELAEKITSKNMYGVEQGCAYCAGRARVIEEHSSDCPLIQLKQLVEERNAKADGA